MSKKPTTGFDQVLQTSLNCLMLARHHTSKEVTQKIFHKSRHELTILEHTIKPRQKPSKVRAKLMEKAYRHACIKNQIQLISLYFHSVRDSWNRQESSDFGIMLVAGTVIESLLHLNHFNILTSGHQQLTQVLRSIEQSLHHMQATNQHSWPHDKQHLHDTIQSIGQALEKIENDITQKMIQALSM